MELIFDKYHPHQFITSLAQQLNQTSQLDCLEKVIDLNSDVGNGLITGSLFSDGIGFLLFNCTFKEDMILHFVDDSPAPLFFFFCTEGQIRHSFDDGNIRYLLLPLQGTITANRLKKEQVMTLPGKQKILFSCLMINRAAYLKKIDCIVDKMPEKLAAIFEDTQAKDSFFYQGNYSISASSCLKKIVNDRHSGLVRSTFFEAKVLELLSRQVKQFKDDLLSPSKQIMLRDYDIKRIKKAEEILLEDLVNPPIIAELAKKAGINQQKLKRGFKIIFDTTINKYLRNERLERASLLILKGHAIKEAAQAVGYSNQSHFATRFKEKYGVLPKEYLKSIQIK